MDYLNYRVRGSQLSSRVNAHDCSAFIILFADVSVCYVQACLSEHTLPVTLPGVVALTLSSLGAGPWLCRQRWAGLWHCSVPTSDEPWCCWPERLGLDWVSGGLGAWGTGTGPQGNLLLWEIRASCYCREQVIGVGGCIFGSQWGVGQKYTFSVCFHLLSASYFARLFTASFLFKWWFNIWPRALANNEHSHRNNKITTTVSKQHEH